jgi:hypothetical protein
MVEAIEPIKGPRGRPRRRPGKLHAAKAYVSRHKRDYLAKRHIGSRISRVGIEPSQRLGRHRWIVERSLAWLHIFRRLQIRYERLDDIHQAFLTLGCALICWTLVCSVAGRFSPGTV